VRLEVPQRKPVDLIDELVADGLPRELVGARHLVKHLDGVHPKHVGVLARARTVLALAAALLLEPAADDLAAAVAQDVRACARLARDGDLLGRVGHAHARGGEEAAEGAEEARLDGDVVKLAADELAVRAVAVLRARRAPGAHARRVEERAGRGGQVRERGERERRAARAGTLVRRRVRVAVPGGDRLGAAPQGERERKGDEREERGAAHGPWARERDERRLARRRRRRVAQADDVGAELLALPDDLALGRPRRSRNALVVRTGRRPRARVRRRARDARPRARVQLRRLVLVLDGRRRGRGRGALRRLVLAEHLGDVRRRRLDLCDGDHVRHADRRARRRAERGALLLLGAHRGGERRNRRDVVLGLGLVLGRGLLERGGRSGALGALVGRVGPRAGALDVAVERGGSTLARARRRRLTALAEAARADRRLRANENRVSYGEKSVEWKSRGDAPYGVWSHGRASPRRPTGTG